MPSGKPRRWFKTRQRFMLNFAPRRWCRICGVPNWLNPTGDHLNWLGHPWTPIKHKPTLEELRNAFR